MILVSVAALTLAPQLSLDSNSFRMGSQWSRVAMTQATAQSLSNPQARRAAFASGYIQVAGGTAFYLGKFGDAHLIATNRHVCETGVQCAGFDVQFPLLQRTYKMSLFAGSMKDTDLSIIKIDVPASDEPMMQSVGRNFSFHYLPKKGQKLLTAGFGAANNPSRGLTLGQDSDCRVLSNDNEIQMIHDPDQENPIEYPVWSFAHGCDVSPGDSGSALINTLGEVVGLVWTGKTPKLPRTQDSTTLYQISGPQTWTELNYGVAVNKIPQAIIDKVRSGTSTPDRAQILLRLIDQAR